MRYGDRVKGEVESNLAYLAIAVVTIIVLVGVFYAIKGNYNKITDDAPCATQILGSSVATRFTKEIAAPTIKCPTARIVQETGDAEAAKRIVADQMVACWNEWGKGKLMLFSDETHTYCHICSTVEISGVQQLDNFGAYLDTAKATKSQTYAQYLHGAVSGTYFDEASLPPLSPGGKIAPLPTQQPIGVILYYAKGQTMLNKMRNDLFGKPVEGAVAGGAVGVLIGAGSISSASGIGVPVTFVTYLAAGSIIGVSMSTWARADSSYATIVLVRPLSEQDIGRLGCTYDPVSN